MPNSSDPNLLPEDGIIDDLAVEIAAHGIREVRLTKRERKLACEIIITEAEPGISDEDLHARVHDYLGLPFYRGRSYYKAAIRLIAACQREQDEEPPAQLAA